MVQAGGFALRRSFGRLTLPFLFKRLASPAPLPSVRHHRFRPHRPLPARASAETTAVR